MARFNWAEITAEDVIKAIKIFDRDNPEHPKSRSTYLLYEGKKYPAKHIRGMAYKVHFNQEINKDNYSGGQETVRFFEKLGFKIQYTHKSVETHPVKTKKSSASAKQNEEHKQEVSVTDSGQKITIPVKRVIEQKNALQLHLNKICGGDIVCEKTFSWMRTPREIEGEYEPLYKALSTYRGYTGFAKKGIALRCDFVCESKKLIIEYDERQHFSEARRISLLSYEDIPLNYDRKQWIDACRDIQAKDNQPKDRDEIRAYYDSVRDIEAAKHGYTLVRIMHGQIDFETENAEEWLKEILRIDGSDIDTEKEPATDDGKRKASLKIGLYLQTNELYGDKRSFDRAMAVVDKSDIDILVFPEFSYVPFNRDYESIDYLSSEEVQPFYDEVLAFSREIRRAVVVCNEDKYGTIMSIFANAFAEDGETIWKNYFKHTMTGFSACEISNYREYAEEMFEPIYFKGYRIGLTICYDCNHSMFSRKYGLNGVDMIINSTGGNVVYDKWHKYNKARAIENNCFTFVTMGGPGDNKNPHNYVFGFTPQGKEMHPVLLNGEDDGRRNISGGIYVYDTAEDDGKAETDSSIDQTESLNKKIDLYLPETGIDQFIRQGDQLSENIYIIKYGDVNLVMCLVEKEDIMKPEKVLKLLYAQELKSISDKRYIIVNRWDEVDSTFYKTKLSSILKVRAMENYCAVILSSANINKAYQCGKNRTAQVVKAVDGKFGIDLERTGGPETIWRNKEGMKQSWRENIEWLIASM